MLEEALGMERSRSLGSFSKERLREIARSRSTDILRNSLDQTERQASQFCPPGAKMKRRGAGESARTVLDAAERIVALASAVDAREGERARVQTDLENARRQHSKPPASEMPPPPATASVHAQAKPSTSEARSGTDGVFDDIGELREERQARRRAEEGLASLRRAEVVVQERAQQTEAAKVVAEAGTQSESPGTKEEGVTARAAVADMACQAGEGGHSLDGLREELERVKMELQRASAAKERAESEAKVLRESLGEALSTHPSVMNEIGTASTRLAAKQGSSRKAK